LVRKKTTKIRVKPSGAFAQMVRTHAGQEPNDPTKVARLILQIAGIAEPPVRPLVGSDAASEGAQARRPRRCVETASSTQAGEFVREEIELIREGMHGARSTKESRNFTPRARRARSLLARNCATGEGKKTP
jgi:hypothetical protein